MTIWGSALVSVISKTVIKRFRHAIEKYFTFYFKAFYMIYPSLLFNYQVAVMPVGMQCPGIL